MTPEEKCERRYNHIEQKWQRLKRKAKPCPDCYSSRLGLNDSYSHKIKRFFLECADCHWCAGSMPTIRLAILDWNRQKSTEEQLYKDR